MGFHQETEVAVFTEIRGQKNFRCLAVQLPAQINICENERKHQQNSLFFFGGGGDKVDGFVLPATASRYRLAPHLLHAEVRYDRCHLWHQHRLVNCAVGGGQHAVLTPEVRAVERGVEARRAWKGGSCHAWRMSAAWKERKMIKPLMNYITSKVCQINYLLMIKIWIMKHTYLRAAMLDIGEWTREWNPGEVVILLWWLCRGLQWRGDMVPTAQLHKS